MRVARFDYHVHESYSADARESRVEHYIEAAERLNIDEIAFTTHQIISGKDSNFGIQLNEISDYVENIKNLDERTKVKLLVGLEIDYFKESEKELEAIIEEYPFDFILGSTHFIGNYDIGSRQDSPSFFKGRSVKEATSEYFEVWRMAIESGLFDIMAHPDYWRRFFYLHSEKPINFSEYGRVNEAIDSLISYDIGIEINSSGRRHEYGVQYPTREFLEAVYSAGLKKITIGSDSHKPEHLGYWLAEAVDLLSDIGFKYVSSFKNRKNKSNPIKTVVKKVKNM